MNYPEYRTITIPQTELRQFTEKVVRGITWHLNKTFVENDHEIVISILRDADALEAYGPFLQHMSHLNVGPGIEIRHAVVPDDPLNAAIAIQIWGRVRLYAFVIRRESEKDAAQLPDTKG